MTTSPPMPMPPGLASMLPPPPPPPPRVALGWEEPEEPEEPGQHRQPDKLVAAMVALQRKLLDYWEIATPEQRQRFLAQAEFATD